MPLTVRDAIGRASLVTESLTELSARLQDLLSERENPEQLASEFQSLDWLTQSLSCLTLFLADIHRGMSSDCGEVSEQALGRVCLTRLQDALRGVQDPRSAQVAADCELF